MVTVDGLPLLKGKGIGNEIQYVLSGQFAKLFLNKLREHNTGEL